MNKKITSYITGIVGLCVLGGCSVSSSTTIEAKCKITNGETICEGGSGTTIKTSYIYKALRPVADMLAEAGVFSYDDFIELDPSEYAYKFEGATINDSRVKLSIYEGDYLLDSKYFAVFLQGGVYRFSEAESVKAYAESFIDIATKVEASANTTKTSDRSTISLLENNSVLASAYHQGPSHELPPTHVQ